MNSWCETKFNYFFLDGVKMQVDVGARPSKRRLKLLTDACGYNRAGIPVA